MSLFGCESLNVAPWIQILLDLKTSDLQNLYLHTVNILWSERHSITAVDTSITKGEERGPTAVIAYSNSEIQSGACHQ